MYSLILQLHSFWALAVLSLVLIATVDAFWGMSANKEFKLRDRKIAMYGMIAAHIQLLFGLIILFMGPYFKSAMDLGMGAVMKDSVLRFFVVEHPAINILAVIIITIGWSRHKKAINDKQKFRSIGMFYLIGFLLLLTRIPWNQWF